MTDKHAELAEYEYAAKECEFFARSTERVPSIAQLQDWAKLLRARAPQVPAQATSPAERGIDPMTKPDTSVPEGSGPTLEKRIERAINSVSAENVSNTPDWILAQFLIDALAAFNTAVQQRETWYGRDARPTAMAQASVTSRPSPSSSPSRG